MTWTTYCPFQFKNWEDTCYGNREKVYFPEEDEEEENSTLGQNKDAPASSENM